MKKQRYQTDSQFNYEIQKRDSQRGSDKDERKSEIKGERERERSRKSCTPRLESIIPRSVYKHLFNEKKRINKEENTRK